MSQIYGVGVDMLEIARIESLVHRWQQSFLVRVLTPAEQEVFWQRYEKNKKNAIRYLASRFAAKEAFLKAMGTGLRPPFTWQTIEIQSKPLGQPYIILSETVAPWCAEQGAGTIHLSLSDTDTHVIAYVMIERLNPSDIRISS